MPRRLSLIGFLLLATVLAPGLAWAQDSVTIDPASPTGKEYEIPLDTARQQAGSAPKKDRKPQSQSKGSDRAPLFGEGVGPDSSGGSAPATPPPADTSAQSPAQPAPPAEQPAHSQTGGQQGTSSDKKPERGAEKAAKDRSTGDRDRDRPKADEPTSEEQKTAVALASNEDDDSGSSSLSGVLIIGAVVVLGIALAIAGGIALRRRGRFGQRQSSGVANS